ncbi:MAG TPA: hypothetical protein VFF37_08345, partial [Streptomyces sp.]|nr:hypothetical protein [Streptomyces sp.]
MRSLPAAPEAADLQGVLSAIGYWRASTTPKSSRWAAVARLENAVRERVEELAHPRPTTQAEPSAQGAAAPYGATPLVPVSPRPAEVDGFGPASGFEAELHGYQVVLPPGTDFAEFGDVVELPGLLKITLDRVGGVPVLEVVTDPARVLERGPFDGRAERSDVLAAFQQVLALLRQVKPGSSMRLGQIFPKSLGYVVDPDVDHLPVKINEAGVGIILVHHTATAPLSGLVPFLRHVGERMRLESTPFEIARYDLDSALHFADTVRDTFAEWRAQHPARAAAATAWDTDELHGALALGYTQVAAAVRERSNSYLPKDLAAVVSRDSLGAVRAGLGDVPRAFLEDQADRLAAVFTSTFNGRATEPVSDPLNQTLRKRGPDHQPATIGQYLDNLLHENPERVVNQDEALTVRTNFRTLEGNPEGGVPRLAPHVVRMEARPYAPTDSTPDTIAAGENRLAQHSLDLYNGARQQRGLEPVGRRLTPEQQASFAPPTVRSAGSAVATGASAGTADTAGIADTGRSVAPLPSVASVSSAALAGLAARLPAISADERGAELASLSPQDRVQLASDEALVQRMRDLLSAAEFRAMAAQWLVVVPSGVEQPEAAREEAEALIAGMLGDLDVAAALLTGGRQFVVVPRGRALTSLAEFDELRGTSIGGRSMDFERAMYRPGRFVGAIPEENLLGETTGVPGAEHAADGYSSARHEVAHAIQSVLTREDQEWIEAVYQAKRARGVLEPWPDGRFPNYSSSSVHDYFAQLTNAYLGANTGTDLDTGAPRNNGADWVEAHDPELLPLLRRLYGPGRTAALGSLDNPYILTGFRALWDQAEAELPPQPDAPVPPPTAEPPLPARQAKPARPLPSAGLPGADPQAPVRGPEPV